MLLSEPPESSYDLRFDFMGIPVRIAWTFWLAALVFGYTGARNIDYLFIDSSPGMFPWLLLWVIVMFVSILVHELGHAFAFRHCGINASVVLYHFGGLAIPLSSRGPGISAMRLGRYENIYIAAAGPGAQLILAVITLAVLHLSGYSLREINFGYAVGPEFLSAIPGINQGDAIERPGVFALADFMLFVNIWWPLLNLIPVWPLDGGRIAREVIVIGGGTTYLATQVSMVVAGIVAVLMFNWGQPFAGFLFVSLAIGSYQLLNTFGHWRM